MDNIIQVIVVIFVIWSILGSALKKKPQAPPQKVAGRIPREGSNKPSPSYQKSSQDVLEEILGFKIPQQNSRTSRETNYEDEDLEISSRDLETDLPEVSSESQYASPPDVNYDKQEALETADSKSLRVDIHKQYLEKVFVTDQRAQIKKKIRDRATLRDAIMITEILNKPKALRK
jgi:hypothetical protein